MYWGFNIGPYGNQSFRPSYLAPSLQSTADARASFLKNLYEIRA